MLLPDNKRKDLIYMGNNQTGVTELENQILTGERALFQGHDLRIKGTIFADGESPLKVCRRGIAPEGKPQY